MRAMLIAIRRGFCNRRLSVGASFLVLLIFFARSIAQCAILGTNPPALPLTAQSINQLPIAERSAWKKYLDHSERQKRADQKFFSDELNKNGIKQSTFPPRGRSARSLPMNQSAEWYRQPET